MITVVAVTIIVIVALSRLFSSSSKSSSIMNTDANDVEAKGSTSSPYTPEELLRAIGGELKFQSDEDEREQTHYFVSFQGGNFHFSFTKGSNWVNTHYSHFYACKLEHLNNALFVANQMNMKYSGWGCYINMENPEKEENPISATLSYAFMMDTKLVNTVNNLKRLMELAFHIAREFDAELNEKIKKKEEIDNTVLTDKEFQYRIAHVQWLKTEEGREGMGEEYPDYPSVLSVSALVKLFDNVDFGCLQDLRIVCGQEVETITDIAEIEAFNIREHIRQRPDAKSIKSLNLTFGFEHQELFVNLTKAKASTENTLIYVVNIVRSGSELDKVMDNRISFSSRTMLEVRLTDAQKDYWEAKYMIDEAMDKVKNGRTDELTDEQRLLVSHVEPSLQADLYWGKKYYNNHCYLQALYHFNRVFTYFKNNPNHWNEGINNLYSEICFYIGFIYDDLGMYDRAFFYLYIAQRTRIDGTQEFVNCLCNMKDVGVKCYIYDQIEEVVNQMKKSEEEADRLMSFYHFLCRRYAYVLIDRNELDDAEKMLKDLIEREQDVEFAKGELEYIRERRVQEALEHCIEESKKENPVPTEEETKSETEEENEQQA